MLNSLVVLYTIFFNQMGVAIIVLTIIIRLVTLPLTLKQLKQMRAMSSLQPKLKEIQDRYSRDRSRVSQETMRLYREAGVSPYLTLIGSRVRPAGNVEFRHRRSNGVSFVARFEHLVVDNPPEKEVVIFGVLAISFLVYVVRCLVGVDGVLVVLLPIP